LPLLVGGGWGKGLQILNAIRILYCRIIVRGGRIRPYTMPPPSDRGEIRDLPGRRRSGREKHGGGKRLTFSPILSSTITPTSDVYPSLRLENLRAEAIPIMDGGGVRYIPLFYPGIAGECQ